MSVKAMAWAFAQPLKPGPKFVLVALADRADEEGLCWPTIRTLAEKCSMHDRTITKILASLDGRYLHATSQFVVGTSSRGPNAYQLFLTGQPTTWTPPGGEMPPPPGGEIPPPPGGNGAPPLVATATANLPSLTPTPSLKLNTSEETSGRATAKPSPAARGTHKGLGWTDEEFLGQIRMKPAYAHLNIDHELSKLDAWLLTPRGRGKRKTQGRIVAWLNRAADEQREIGSSQPASDRCVARVQDGYRLRACGQAIAAGERGKPKPLCDGCLAERVRIGVRAPPTVQTSG